MTNAELADIFFEEWESGKQEFSIQTSGSIGAPKTIVLKRQWMIWSAEQTAKVLNPINQDSILCCLPVSKVGGLMQLVRAKVWGVEILVVEPLANPLNLKTSCNIISLTPYQLFYVLNDEVSIKNLRQCKEVLIGGSDIAESLVQKIQSLNFETTVFRHSYGMTETCSHIALRTLNGINKTNYFTPFDEIEITINENKCAQLKMPFYSEIIQTNDIIELQTNNTFKVLGRADNTINSGGVKLQPEVIEKAIRDHFGIDEIFYIASKSDVLLGQKLVLITEPSFTYQLSDLDFLKTINPYAVPKEIIYIEKLERNDGGKIRRKVF